MLCSWGNAPQQRPDDGRPSHRHAEFVEFHPQPHRHAQDQSTRALHQHPHSALRSRRSSCCPPHPRLLDLSGHPDAERLVEAVVRDPLPRPDELVQGILPVATGTLRVRHFLAGITSGWASRGIVLDTLQALHPGASSAGLARPAPVGPAAPQPAVHDRASAVLGSCAERLGGVAASGSGRHDLPACRCSTEWHGRRSRPLLAGPRGITPAGVAFIITYRPSKFFEFWNDHRQTPTSREQRGVNEK